MGMFRIKPGAAGSGSKYANQCAMLPTTLQNFSRGPIFYAVYFHLSSINIQALVSSTRSSKYCLGPGLLNFSVQVGTSVANITAAGIYSYRI